MTHKTQEITHHRDEVVGVHDRVDEAVENNRQEDVAVVPWAAQEKKTNKNQVTTETIPLDIKGSDRCEVNVS